MKRTILLGGVIGLAASVVAGLLVRMRWESPVNAAETGLVSIATERDTDPEPVSSVLPIPDTVPIEGAVIDTRRPAQGPPVWDFEARYGNLSPEERLAQSKLISARLQEAVSARFDELHAQFRDLRARKQYSARVIKDGGSPFRDLRLHHLHNDMCSARPEILDDGSVEIHVLELCPRTEPTTCELFEELTWLNQSAR